MRLRLPFVLLALVVVALPQCKAHGQFGVYGLFSGGILGSTPTIPGSNAQHDAGFSSGGFTIGAYDEFTRTGPIHFGIDGRYFSQSSSNSNSYGNKLHGPLKPYVQAEAGGVGTNYGINANTTSSSAWQVNGGIDYTVLPHLDLRAEYGGGLINAYQGGNQTLQEFGGGVVLRF